MTGQMFLHSLHKKVHNFRRDVGLWGLSAAIGRRIMTRLGRMSGVSVTQIRVRQFDSDNPPVRTRVDIELREVSMDQLLAYPQLETMKLTKAYVRDAAARGYRAAGAYDGDRLVGYAFGAIGGGPATESVWVETDPLSAYGFNVFVHKDYRGLRIAPALMQLGDELLHLEGVETGVGFVAVSNLASRRFNRVANSDVVGYAGYIDMGGFFWPFRSPGAKKAGFRYFKPDSH